MKNHKMSLVMGLLALSCSTFNSAPLKTIDNIAHEACGVFFARERGISFVEAAEALCATEDQLRPFIQGLRSAGRKADARAKAMVR